MCVQTLTLTLQIESGYACLLFNNKTIACYVSSKHTLSGGGVIKGGSVRILSGFLDVRKWLVQQIIISYTYVG